MQSRQGSKRQGLCDQPGLRWPAAATRASMATSQAVVGVNSVRTTPDPSADALARSWTPVASMLAVVSASDSLSGFGHVPQAGYVAHDADTERCVRVQVVTSDSSSPVLFISTSPLLRTLAGH